MASSRTLNYMPGLVGGMALIFGMINAPAWAQECGEDGEFGECRVLVEINSTDGDVGFHWLADGDDLRSTRIDDPNGEKVFENSAFGALREQKLTESFGESAEPPCWFDTEDPEADPDEVLTLRDFREIWAAGTYAFRGKGEEGEKYSGEAELTYNLPAAPMNLDFDGSVISWAPGMDLGRCASVADIPGLIADGTLAEDPFSVPVLAFEVVMEPDVDDTDWRTGLVFSTRVAGDTYAVTVPADYLASLGDDTPVKIEVGAIGGNFEIVEDEVEGDADNATFTEAEGFCVNEDSGCED